ncbi:MAG TPA: methionine--tRNA ligase [Pyrinomonadaceae bacterium]|jgi:methionyl-tRNA synthetase|nr:methionine--tRNA ligase [Pyrinomonadaceae bacterium]
MKSFYVTTPIYYANSLPHLGHLYTTAVADCLARYRRQRGFETCFLTGTDEHGINIERSAAKQGRTPKEHVDYVVGELKTFFASFRLDGEHGGYDIFMRTSEPFHYEAAQNFWRRVASNLTPKGRESIYKSFYEGWFCAPCGTFKTQDELAKPAREGDPPLCLIHEAPVDRVSEEGYFFRLSDYDDALLKLYEERPELVVPDARRNEVRSFVHGGLQDISISRLKSSVRWGIPVPEDPEHTIYIWFDALLNYITALGFGSHQRRHEVGEGMFEKFWPGVHLIGKDILRQHAILWPAMLLAAGVEQPRAVVAHGMWLDPQGRKVSKTLGNMIDIELVRRHTSADVVRYVLLREKSFWQDGRLGYEIIFDRANSDLASGLGNLVSRTLAMIGRYFDGVVPSPDINEGRRLAAKRAGVDSDAQALASSLELTRDQFVQGVEAYEFNRALEALWAMIARVDKFISDVKPWELAKSEEQRETLGAVLYRSAETIRWLAVLLHPFMPESSQAIARQLGLADELGHSDPTQLKWGGLRQGTRIGEVAPLFPRIDKVKVMAEIEKELAEKEQGGQVGQTQGGQTQAAPSGAQPSGAHATQAAVPGAPTADARPAPPAQGATGAQTAPGAQSQGAQAQASASQPEGVASFITIEDFVKVEMRVGEVLTAERVPKSDKLLRFTIDLGEAEPRQILAGIAEYYEPEKLVGRKVAVVSNLKPRKLRGFESQGMVLAASVGAEGRPVLATFNEDVPNGARLK